MSFKLRPPPSEKKKKPISEQNHACACNSGEIVEASIRTMRS